MDEFSSKPPNKEPRPVVKCHAKTRKGALCPNIARQNGRCRRHGGLSTGAKTPEGLAKVRQANWKHGYCSKQFKDEQRQMREFMKLILSVEQLSELSPVDMQRHFEALKEL